jgi:hypothetical protein
MTTGQYRLLICDLRTDQLLESISAVHGVSYEDYIGKSGSLTATLPVANASMARTIRETVLPGRTMLWLEQAGQLVWGGVLWTRTPARDQRGTYTCTIQAGGLESYFRSHRLLLADLTAVGADQFDIARQLVTYAQAQAGGDLGIEMDASLSGVLRDRTYSRFDLPWIGNLVDDLAAVDGGFEWRIQAYRDDAGARHRTLRLGYPKLTVGTDPVDLSSTVSAYSLPEDATIQANTWISRGASTNTDSAATSVPIMSDVLTTPADIAAGWARLDGTSDYSTVTDLTVLGQHAAADLARSIRPVVIPSISYTGSAQPQLGQYVRLRLRDTWYYDGLDQRYRVIGYKVTPAERGQQQSTQLYLEAA